ncbi:hypothetical protein QRX50_28445 [Amycolatopsis carbonis]|uniref:Uncharacterized protein n=1 Tax=Amycolatopsis carbonis TaxID=715471 RepID=A0A9Y2I7Y9_9PSEU|nr:hypothetical protein [Amycolatopsis sp. 2-15]WIX75440.1 hypothetical protein QRX50_28445 [Amycolatopsis sp. 2-15]
MDSMDLTGIAEPHLSTVAAIVGYVRQGRFTEAEAQRMIDRVRARGPESPYGTVGSGLTTAAGENASPEPGNS